MKMINVETKEEVHGTIGTTMAYATGKTQEVIERFANSGLDIVELIFGRNEYRSMASAHGSITQAIRSTGRPYKVSTRSGHMYLAKRIG